MKKKGFTLIELVVVVAIILLLAATLAPKLRKEVAKARDAKAVAALGSLRTAANVYLADTGKGATKIYGTSADTAFIISDDNDSSEYLEPNLVTYLKVAATPAEDAVVAIGGARANSTTTVTYGGGKYIDYNPSTVELSIAGSGTITGSVGSAYTVTSTDVIDTKGNTWSEY